MEAHQSPERHDSNNMEIDLLAAGTAAISSAPLVAIIDRMVTQATSGTHTAKSSLRESFTMVIFRPLQYFSKPDFWLLWTVYSSTYATANLFGELA